MNDEKALHLDKLDSFQRGIYDLVFLMGWTSAHSLSLFLRQLPKQRCCDFFSAAIYPNIAELRLTDVFKQLLALGLFRTNKYCHACVPLPLPVQRRLFEDSATGWKMDELESYINSKNRFETIECEMLHKSTKIKLASRCIKALLEDRVSEIDKLFDMNWDRSCNYGHDTLFTAFVQSVVIAPDDVSPKVVFHLLPYVAEKALVNCTPMASRITEILNDRVSGIPRGRIVNSRFLDLCAWCVWTASRAGLHGLEERAGEMAQVKAVEACLALLDGDFAAADKAFAKTLRALPPEDYLSPDDGHSDGFLFAAALTAIRVNGSQARVRSLTEKLSGKVFVSGYLLRNALSLEPLNQVANLGGVALPSRGKEPLLPAQRFIHSLETLFVDNSSVSPEIRKGCLEHLVQADASGFDFIAASLVPCVRRLLPDDPAAQEVCRRVAEGSAAVPLWAESRITSPWEHALREIAKLLPKQAAAGEESAPERASLVKWILVFDAKKPEDVELVQVWIRLSKRLKSGKMSSGQTLDIDKLCRGDYDKSLDACDVPVKECLVRVASRHPFYSSYDTARAYPILSALVGHPHVYTVSDAHKRGYVDPANIFPIRLVKGEIALEIENPHDGAKSVLQLSCASESTYPDLQVSKVRKDLFTVYEKSPVLKRLEEIICKYGKQGRLAVPAEGADSLRQILTPLARLVGVKGDFDAESVSARTFDGGVDLHLRTRFIDAMLHVELVNRPVVELPLFVPPGGGVRKTLMRHEEETVAVVRDLEAERTALAEFLSDCPSLAAWTLDESHWEVEGLSEILTVLNEIHGVGDRLVLEWPEGEPLSVLRPATRSPFSLTSGSGAEFWLEIGGDVTLDDGKVVAFSDLLSKIGDATEGFVRLSDRQFLFLTKALVRQLDMLANAGELSKSGLKLPPSSIPLLDSIVSSKTMIDFPKLVRTRIADFQRAFAQEHQVPSSLTCELRPYQHEGYAWLAKLDACGLGACLADDMGLGKTVQLLALMTACAAEGPSLVIAPASVLRNWENEAARFAPALRVSLLSEATDRAALVSSAGPFDVVVCGYGLLTFEEEILSGRRWNLVVLDEAQTVKNHLAKRTKIVKRLDARMRTVATGTPVENNLAELWSLFDFINPGLLGTYGQFERRFCNPDGTVSPLLKRMTSPFILRRLKSEVLDDLPPKTEIAMTVTLDDDERALYESCRREALTSLESQGDEASHIQILAHLTKLRRVCCHPSLIVPDCKMQGQKVAAFLELVEDLRAGGHRALVFSQFVDFLSIIRRRLDEQGVSYQYLDGSTSLKRRDAAVESFQRGEGDLFLISLKAGGTGLNLTAANYVILLDPWWNPAVEMQAADRAHRIGQRNPVTIYRLVTADTVEERVVELHARKREIADAILEGTGSTRLSASELAGLFKP